MSRVEVTVAGPDPGLPLDLPPGWAVLGYCRLFYPARAPIKQAL